MRSCTRTDMGIFTKSWKKRRSLSITMERESKLTCAFFFLGRNDDTFPLDLVINQNQPRSRVSIRCFSVLGGSAVSDINARIVIGKAAKGSEAFFSHHILLLSDHAQGKTIPSLEIMTHDVSARHQASITTLDEESRFYLESRGLDRPMAATILIHGFLRVPDECDLDEKSKKRAEYIFDSFTKRAVYE